MARGYGRILTRGLDWLLGLLEFLPCTIELSYRLLTLLVIGHLDQDLVRDSDHVLKLLSDSKIINVAH